MKTDKIKLKMKRRRRKKRGRKRERGGGDPGGKEQNHGRLRHNIKK